MKTILCAGAFALLLTANAAAKPGVAVSTVNLRAESNTTSAIVAKIPGGARIDVGACAEGWCAVTFQGRSGFAIATALDTSGRMSRPVRRPMPGYDPDDDYEPAYPPGYVVGPSVYVGPPIAYGPWGPHWGPYWGPRWGYGGGWRRW